MHQVLAGVSKDLPSQTCNQGCNHSLNIPLTDDWYEHLLQDFWLKEKKGWEKWQTQVNEWNILVAALSTVQKHLISEFFEMRHHTLQELERSHRSGRQCWTRWRMGAHRIFSRGGQIRGLDTKVPQLGPGREPRWGYRGKAPRSRQWVVKIMHK